MRKRFCVGLVFSLLAFKGWPTDIRAEPADQSQSSLSPAIYDADPNHLWNRLFVAFYRQKISNNTYARSDVGFYKNQIEEARWVGPDVLDPPLGYHPKFMLDDEPFLKCNALLDEFLNRHGAGLIRDPLKRAMLQHDLWAVFDVLTQAAQIPTFPMGPWTSIEGPADSLKNKPQWAVSAVQEQHRLILERKLAQVIRSLALSRAEIENLPDTYRAAILSGAFSDVLDSGRYDFLPHDLFTTNSGWLEISPGPSPSKGVPQLLDHTLVAGGRCIFRTFVKPPAGYQGTNFSSQRFPNGAQFLLLREMICLDEHWRMVPTHVVESVQFRASLKEQSEREHRFAREAELSRALLFQGKQGGLRPIPKGEPRVRNYDGLGHLRVDDKGNSSPFMTFPQNCGQCHADALFLFSQVAGVSKPARSASIEPIARWKQERGKLDQLRKLILSAASDAK